MFYTAGIDVGSSSVKTALMRFDAKGGAATLLTCNIEKLRKRNTKDVIVTSFGAALEATGLKQDDIAYIASTGEGELVDFRKGHFYSMTCHARGGLFLNEAVRSVLDMGALHSKALVMDHRSKVLSYRMTSQCASGSGQFLENIARYLGVATEDIGELSLKSDRPEQVSGICAVLAETDVINMVSRGISTSNILKGIHLSMARRLVNLLRMMKAEGDVLATGGLSRDVGLLAAIQELADKDKHKIRMITNERSVFAGAIGAAVWAAFRNVKLNNMGQRSMQCKLTLGDMTRNIGTMLLNNRDRFADKPAFAERTHQGSGPYRRWTWGELVNDATTVAANLRDRDLQSGDRVAFVSANSYARLVGEMAVMAQGLTSVPIFAGYDQELLLRLIKFSDVKLLIADDPQKFSELGIPVFSTEEFAALTSKHRLRTEAETAMKNLDPSQIAVMMFTSGTSGFPKGVQLTHRNLMSQQKALELLWKPESGMRFLCYLPWHHSFGGLFERFFALHSGGMLAIDDSWGRNTDQLLKNFSEIKPNVYFSVPKVYQEIVTRILTSKELERIFFSPELKFVFTAAAPLPLSTSDVFKERKIPVVEGWGLTETSPCCTLTERSLTRKPGVVGFPLPGVEVRLGLENEIEVRGPNVMVGYFKAHDATTKVLNSDGWFSTGDVGEITDAGLRIISRKDRMFKLSNGEKIFPAQIEENVKTGCKFIKHAYVFGSGKKTPYLLVFPNKELFGLRASPSDCSGCVYPDSMNALSRCLGECLAKINANSAIKIERVERALVINRELTIEGHELTPSFKLVPLKLAEHFKEYIAAVEENKLDQLPSDAYVINIGGSQK